MRLGGRRVVDLIETSASCVLIVDNERNGSVVMEGPHADYNAVERALLPHQLQTVRDYARSQGIESDAWWHDRMCCIIATSLAVDNVLRESLADGLSEKQALTSAAVRLDLDVETLQRHCREIRRRTQSHKSSGGL